MNNTIQIIITDIIIPNILNTNAYKNVVHFVFKKLLEYFMVEIFTSTMILFECPTKAEK